MVLVQNPGCCVHGPCNLVHHVASSSSRSVIIINAWNVSQLDRKHARAETRMKPNMAGVVCLQACSVEAQLSRSCRYGAATPRADGDPPGEPTEAFLGSGACREPSALLYQTALRSAIWQHGLYQCVPAADCHYTSSAHSTLSLLLMLQDRSRNSLMQFPQSVAVADGINWGYRLAAQPVVFVQQLFRLVDVQQTRTKQ